jgi:hypothetical protein
VHAAPARRPCGASSPIHASSRHDHADVLDAGACMVMIESEGINYGPEVNLFIDHSQVVELAALRAGIWGPKVCGDGS